MGGIGSCMHEDLDSKSSFIFSLFQRFSIPEEKLVEVVGREHRKEWMLKSFDLDFLIPSPSLENAIRRAFESIDIKPVGL